MIVQDAKERQAREAESKDDDDDDSDGQPGTGNSGTIPEHFPFVNHFVNSTILESNMKPGDQFPSEYELSKILGVGRAVR